MNPLLCFRKSLGRKEKPELPAERGQVPLRMSKLELAERAFKQVWDNDVHLDTKASMTLGAMAFLSTASAAVLARAYSPSWLTSELKDALSQALSPHVSPGMLPGVVSQVLQGLRVPYTFLGLDWSLLAFSLYLLFVLIGSIFYLSAIGPKLNIPRRWGSSEPGEDGGLKQREVTSLLFYRKIAADGPKWPRYWKDRQTSELEEHMEECFVYETRLIAEQTSAKYTLLCVGNRCFRIAFFFWVALLAGLLSNNSSYVWLLSYVGWACLSFSIAVTAWVRVPREMGRLAITSIFAVACLAAALLILCGVPLYPL